MFGKAVAAAVLSLAISTPATAAEFGANVDAPQMRNLTAIEADAGRKMDSTRVFFRWPDASFPGDYLPALKGTGRTPMVSVQAARAGGARISYAAIADAKPGSGLYADMVRVARYLKSFGSPVRFTFNHEPGVGRNRLSGPASDYKRAWVKFASVIKAQGAANVRFMWIMTSYDFRVPTTDWRYAPKWYPGDAWVDIIAADAYNWFTCRTDVKAPWRSLEYLAEPVRRFAAQHPNEGLYLAEWSTVEDPADPGRKAQWINQGRTYLKAHPAFDGVSWFEASGGWEGEDCGWTVRTSASALRAFREMGADPYFGGGS